MCIARFSPITSNTLNALVSSEQFIRLSKRLKQSPLKVESQMNSGNEFQTVAPVREKA